MRTFFSQWLVAKRDDTQDTHTKVTILPKSIGKEGSLVDADGESPYVIDTYVCMLTSHLSNSAEMRRLAQK